VHQRHQVPQEIRGSEAERRDLRFRGPFVEMFFDRSLAQWRDLRFLLGKPPEILSLEGEPQSGLVLPLWVMGIDGGDSSVGSWTGIHIGIRKAKLRVIQGIE
jgi:hypothetical protein